jgi:hypothetical protein
VLAASLVDLAGMKMRVIQVRGSWKDYVDIRALVLNGLDLATGLAAARAIGASFRPGDEYSCPSIFWRWNTGSGAGWHEARSDKVGTADRSGEIASIARKA